MDFISGTALSHLRLSCWIAALLSRDHGPREKAAKRHIAKRHIAKPAGLFGNLPSELLSDITKRLGADDVACLALTCQSMRDFLGPPIRWRTDEDGYDMCTHQRFLFRYARDLPGWVACFACLKLHPLDSIDRPGALTGRGRIWHHGPGIPYLHPSIPYHFDFLSLQMVMDEYRATGSTAALDGLRFTCVKDRMSDEGSLHKVLTSIEAKVMDGALFMRVEEVISIDAHTARNIIGPSSSFTREKFLRLDTCAHGGTFAPFSGLPIWGPFYSGVFSITPPTKDPETLEQDFLCSICGMAGARKLMKLKDGGEACAMTRWIRLGTGKPFDCGDAIWMPMFGHILSFVE